MTADRSLLEAALFGYQAKIAQLDKSIAEIRAELGGAPASTPSRQLDRPKRHVSAAARKRMAAGQRRRWRAAKKAKAAE